MEKKFCLPTPGWAFGIDDGGMRTLMGCVGREELPQGEAIRQGTEFLSELASSLKELRGQPQVVAVLSSTVLTDGTFSCENIPFPKGLVGIPHYVGHPATKGLVEALGAMPAPTKLFVGLAVGESYLAVPLAVNPRAEGYTTDIAISDVSQLQAKLITRLA